MKKIMKKSFLAVGLASALVIAGCGSKSEETVKEDGTVHYGEAVDYTITGIEPGAGISVTTESALEAYDNLADWELELSSTAAMMSALDTAIKNESPIIVTGWNPHWMFAKYPDLKYLEDPKDIFGGEEGINTLTRTGLEDDLPAANKFLSQFEWDIEDMEQIMYDAEEAGSEVEDVAKQWVADNQDKVAVWTDGVDGTGEAVELVSTPWDSERASSGVVKEAMEQVGFEVKVTPVDVAIVFETLANGDADATVAAWLPMTHKDFYEKHQDDLVDLGANLTGAKIGIAVPSYMDIDSIEDLEAK